MKASHEGYRRKITQDIYPVNLKISRNKECNALSILKSPLKRQNGQTKNVNRKAYKMKNLIFPAILIILVACQNSRVQKRDSNTFRDEKTENLYRNLKKLSTDGKIMFGCANPTTLMYKEQHINEGFNNSDCKEITGQNPAYYESDFMWFERESYRETDIEAMRKAYERGAVVGYCWHLRGKESNLFYSDSRSGYTADKNLVNKIIAGGPREQNPELDWFYTKLDSLVIPTFVELGFPLTFRPWHEMNGFWFWWGAENCTPEEYIKLYRLTVDYIRSKQIRNVIYIWSPDTRLSAAYYPGDDYVDILGVDIYEMGAIDYKPEELIVAELEKLTDFAASHNKIAAITETGLRIQDSVFRYPEEIPDYWSNYVLKPILENSKLKRLVWVESWYSVDWSKKRNSQFYIPYKGIEKDFKNGQKAIDDFIRFYQNPATLFEDDLPNMYK